MKQQVYKGVDLFKLIASLMVVILHCLGDTLGEPGELFVRNVTSAAVPFFFATSGFFFASGLEKTKNKLDYALHYCIRSLKLYSFWALIYLFLSLPRYFETYGGSLIYLAGIIIRRMVFVGMGAYWYFLALAEAAFLLYLFLSKKLTSQLIIFSAVCYIVGVLFSGFRAYFSDFVIVDRFFDLIYLLFSWNNNFIFLGLPCMTVGWIIYKERTRITLHTSITLLFVTFALKFLELPISNLIWGNENQIAFFQLFTGASMLCFALMITPRFRTKTSLHFRNISIVVYLLHSIFIFFIDETQQKNGIFVFLIVVFLCLLSYFVVQRSSSKSVKFIFAQGH